MNEDKIKELRHSFTNPYREDLPKPKVNQFGHTILSESTKDLDVSEIELKFDEFGQIRADFDKSLIDTKKMSEWSKIAVNLQSAKIEDEIENSTISKDVYSSLLAELDEMDGNKKIVEKPKVLSKNYKNCSNKDCLYELPKDANFCLKCGTAQMAKFCIECGFNFKAEEKFCPDCGTKR